MEERSNVVQEKEKNVLFLQSPYSFFFNDLGIILKKYNYNCYSINFNLGDVFLKKNLKNIPFWREIKKIKIEQDYNEIIKKILKIDNIFIKYALKIEKRDLNEKEKLVFYRYYKFFKKFVIENDIKLVLMQNDLRWQHAIAINILNNLGVNYYVFELGLFRPNTITMDRKGVNYNNSVPKEIEFYKKKIFKNNNFVIESVDSEITEKQRNLYLILYLFFSKIRKNGDLKNNKSSLIDYFNRFKEKYFFKKNKNNEDIKINGNYIFVPLQVSTDTQILVHSDYNNMEEFMEEVILSVAKYNNNKDKKIKLVFKEHPMDIGKVNYQRFYKKHNEKEWIIFLKEGNTKELIKNCSLLITINSTVGLEAIEANKNVISMGRSFYSFLERNIISSHLSLVEKIELLLKIKNDENIINNFINYIKYHYSIEGNEYFYNTKILYNIVSIINQELEVNKNE